MSDLEVTGSPTMSWHCSESPVVSVASKSVITITSFAVSAAIAARFLSQWNGALGDQSQIWKRALQMQYAVRMAAPPMIAISTSVG